MKFCYLDESEGGNGSVVVAAGVVVDGTRMHLTKAAWASLLESLTTRLGSTLREFKASDLYRGAGRWHGMSGADRGAVIGDVISWIAARKHKIVYSGGMQSQYDGSVRPERGDIPDLWCCVDRHILLTLQRHHQTLPTPKGQTVVVADQSSHSDHLVQFVRSPEPWTDTYYGRAGRTERLDQIVDVPYFVDSVHAVLVQTADLCAYILRRYVELMDIGDRPRYSGEVAQVTTWARALAARAPVGDIWPARNRTAAHELFREVAPPALVGLRP